MILNGRNHNQYSNIVSKLKFKYSCDHCSTLKSTWRVLAEKLGKTNKIVVAKANCGVEKGLCKGNSFSVSNLKPHKHNNPPVNLAIALIYQTYDF